MKAEEREAETETETAIGRDGEIWLDPVTLLSHLCRQIGG